MNLLLFSSKDIIIPGRIAVGGDRLIYMRSVHRATVGDSLRLGEINGNTGEGVIRSIDEHGAEIDYRLDQPPPAKLPVTLVMALPRPKMLRRVLRTVAELGIAQLHLINSARVEKSYWQTPALAPTAIEQYFLQGLEQARDTVLPSCHCHKLFRPFAEDTLPELTAGKRALVAHPGPFDTVATAATDSESLLMAIGPEGGWVPFELDLLVAAGCLPVTLGDRILRYETALPVVIGRLFPQLQGSSV